MAQGAFAARPVPTCVAAVDARAVGAGAAGGADVAAPAAGVTPTPASYAQATLSHAHPVSATDAVVTLRNGVVASLDVTGGRVRWVHVPEATPPEDASATYSRACMALADTVPASAPALLHSYSPGGPLLAVPRYRILAAAPEPLQSVVLAEGAGVELVAVTAAAGGRRRRRGAGMLEVDAPLQCVRPVPGRCDELLLGHTNGALSLLSLAAP